MSDKCDEHKDGHQCECCQHGAEEAARRQEEIMKEHGWIVHLVLPEEGEKSNMVDMHTHGLVEKYDHVELQLVAWIGQEKLMDIMHTVVDRIENGETFEPDRVYMNVLANDMPVATKLVCGSEGTPQLRIILPDASGSVDPDAMRSPWDMQHTWAIDDYSWLH